MKCSGENVILRGIFHVVSSFPLHFMLYRVILDCFSNSVRRLCTAILHNVHCTAVLCLRCVAQRQIYTLFQLSPQECYHLQNFLKGGSICEKEEPE